MPWKLPVRRQSVLRLLGNDSRLKLEQNLQRFFPGRFWILMWQAQIQRRTFIWRYLATSRYAPLTSHVTQASTFSLCPLLIGSIKPFNTCPAPQMDSSIWERCTYFLLYKASFIARSSTRISPGTDLLLFYQTLYFFPRLYSIYKTTPSYKPTSQGIKSGRNRL